MAGVEAGAHGVLLTICGDRALRRTADSRQPIDNSIHYFDVAVHQIHAAPDPSGAELPTDPPYPPEIEVEDLTVLTGWAQAVAETLAYAPERVLGLVADSGPGARWRTTLNIAEPSQKLCDALDILGHLVQTCASTGRPPTLSSLIETTHENRPDEGKLVGLVRGVLRSTLEQRQSRLAREADDIS